MESFEENVLNKILKVGRLCGIIPSLERNKFYQKVYTLIVFILLAVGLIITGLFKKRFYEKLNLAKLAIHIMLDTSAYCINFYTSIVVVFYKDKKLKLLINNFRKMSLGKNPPKKYYNFKFYFFNFGYFATMFYSLWLWIKFFRPEYYKQYILDTIQLYPQFFYSFLMYVFLNMILARYKYLTHLIEEHTKNYVFFFAKVKLYISTLNQCIHIFNSIFGWAILLIIFYSSLRLLVYIELLIRSAKKIENTIHNLSVIILLLVSSIKYFQC